MGFGRLLTAVVLFLMVACSNQSKTDLLETGVEQLRGGNLRDAVVCLKNALELDPNYYEARYALGDAYLQLRQYQQAENEFEKVYRQNPAYPADLLLKLAQIYEQTARFNQALEILETFHQSHRPSAVSLDLTAVVYRSMQQFHLADLLFKRAAQLDPENPLPVYHLAQSLLSQSHDQDARILLEKMLEDFSAFKPAYNLLAELNLSQNRINDALEVYQRLFQVDPDNRQALYMRGLLLLALDRSVEVQDVIGLFIKRFPLDYRGTQLSGINAYKSGDDKEALVYLRQSQKDQPQPLTYYYLGLSHFRQKEFELAINQYQRVLDERPASSQTRLMLAMTFLHQMRLEDCLQQIRLVLKYEPENSLAYNIMGHAYLLQKEDDKAVDAFGEAVANAPELIDIYIKKSQKYALRGESDMAENELVTALVKSSQVLDICSRQSPCLSGLLSVLEAGNNY